MVYSYKERMSFRVCMSLYMLHDECQALGNSVRLHLLAPYKTYKGHHAERCIACLSMSPVHQCEHGKGKGTERMLMLLSPCCVAQVMGLEGCVGVHSTSRPPQKDLSFPQLPLIVGLRYVGICLHTSFFTCIVALLVEG